jgi:hypothetical protein
MVWYLDKRRNKFTYTFYGEDESTFFGGEGRYAPYIPLEESLPKHCV